MIITFAEDVSIYLLFLGYQPKCSGKKQVNINYYWFSKRVSVPIVRNLHTPLHTYMCLFQRMFQNNASQREYQPRLISSPAPTHTSHYHRFITNSNLDKIYQKKILGYWTELSATSQKPRTQESGSLPQYCPSYVTLGSHPAS